MHTSTKIGKQNCILAKIKETSLRDVLQQKSTD